MQRRRGSSRMATAGMLVVGIVIGAGFIFGTLYATGSLQPRTTITTQSVIQVTTITTQSVIQVVTTFQPPTTVTQTATQTLVMTTTETLTTFGANLQLSAANCASGAAGNMAGDAYCVLSLTNTGGSTGFITGCSIYGTTEISGPGTAPPIVAGSVAVPAGTTSAEPVSLVCDGAAITAGAVVTGSLVVESGSPLPFSAIAS